MDRSALESEHVLILSLVKASQHIIFVCIVQHTTLKRTLANIDGLSLATLKRR